MKMTPLMRRFAASLALLLSLCFLLQYSFALPAGASITSNSTDNGPTISPDGITNNRSTITTMILNAIQQDQSWKAYVGNVTGTLTLDDSDNNTIYDWTGITTASGEVFASRSGTLDFSSVTCADAATVNTEHAAVNMTGTEVDSIRLTFNSTAHTPTTVAGTTLSNCNMTSLYVNNVSQGQTGAADFQEFLMEEATNSLVYVAIMNDNTVGFDGSNYDFQLIVAESDTEAPHAYYFYVELDG